MGEAVTTQSGVFEIRSEAHGPHWIAWLTRSGSDKPERSVVLIGETQEEAETRARAWAERL
jgi:hypothetical protein